MTAIALEWRAYYAKKQLAAGNLEGARDSIFHIKRFIDTDIPADRGRVMTPKKGRGKDELHSVLREIIECNPKAKPDEIIKQLKQMGDEGNSIIDDVDYYDERVLWVDEMGRLHDPAFRRVENKISEIKSELRKSARPEIPGRKSSFLLRVKERISAGFMDSFKSFVTGGRGWNYEAHLGGTVQPSGRLSHKVIKKKPSES